MKNEVNLRPSAQAGRSQQAEGVEEMLSEKRKASGENPRPGGEKKKKNEGSKAAPAQLAHRLLISILSLVLAIVATTTTTTGTAAATVAASAATGSRAETLNGSAQTSPEQVKPGVTSAPKPSAPDQTSIQNVEATQAALVSEFDVNGLKVIVKRRPGSLTVAAGLFLRGGARNITAENAGIEALMLDVATEASSGFPRERLRAETSRMGTVIGSGVNYDYSALTLASTRANFDRSWALFTDVALRPSFTSQDVELVQSRLVASLRDDVDDPDDYLQRLQERVAYAGHPYFNRPRGTVETVSRLTSADLQRYHRQMMQTSRLLLVIVGDLDPSQLRQQIAQTFGKLPRGDYHPTPLPQLDFATPSVEVTKRGLPTNYIQGLFAAPALTASDIYPMRIASSVLRDRVFEEVRVKRNLSYAPSAFLSSQGANVGGIYVTAVDANRAVRVMLDEIGRLQHEPISPEEITGVVSQYLTSYYMGQETNAAQAGELAQYELIGGGWRNSLVTIERLRAVTPADVQRVARAYMRNIRFVVIGNPDQIDKTVFTGQAGE
ncbi:MAG TPA: pitrilysin family protein [Pyrinomonadaceae bacterium]|jgi:predicted Zn-dependent peptidase|nr:pitrilysin family protein [Pyrinomonadaceae bacterium]